MNPVLTALHELLEAPGIPLDTTGAEPYDWKPGQYLWQAESSPVERAFETGPSARQDFEIRYVFVAEAHEEAPRERVALITTELDDREAAVFGIVRANRANATWLHLEAAADPRPPATLTTRARALRITGYRFV